MNKTILITGAAKRIGKEIALTFSQMGWKKRWFSKKRVYFRS